MHILFFAVDNSGANTDYFCVYQLQLLFIFFHFHFACNNTYLLKALLLLYYSHQYYCIEL